MGKRLNGSCINCKNDTVHSGILVVFDCHRISYTGKADEKNYRTAYGWNDIIFLFILKYWHCVQFLSMEISYALLAGTGNLGGAVCQFDCSKLGFYYEINPV